MVTCPQTPEIVCVGDGCAFLGNAEKNNFYILKVKNSMWKISQPHRVFLPFCGMPFLDTSLKYINSSII